MLNDKITDLKKRLIEYGEHVEKMLQCSIKGLLDRNKDILEEVINKYEPLANEYELEFDGICIHLIAQYQPVAKNLRTLISGIKMSNDLERMADHAVNIAQYSLALIEKPSVKEFIDLPKMAEITASMLKDGIKAFVDEDINIAKEVCSRDNDVDNLNLKIKDDIAKLMKSDSNLVNRSLKLIAISGNLERIADLTTNICEDVIYFAEGTVIKHNSLQK